MQILALEIVSSLTNKKKILLPIVKGTLVSTGGGGGLQLTFYPCLSADISLIIEKL
jgi:hypothetical protein